MALVVIYILLFLNVQTHIYEVCAWRKDGLPYIYDSVADLRDISENMLDYLGKIQGIFCPEQPICYEQDKYNNNNIPQYLMIGNNTIYVENISTYMGICCLPCSCLDSCLEDDNCCLTKSFASNTGVEHDNATGTEPVNARDSEESTEPVNARDSEESTEPVNARDSEEPTEPVNARDSEESVKSECIGASFQTYFKRLKYPATIARYSMVARCYTDKSNRSLVSKCETPTTADFEETLPVTSNTTGRIYWNKFCALCNNDNTELVIWNSAAISQELLFYVNMSVTTLFPKPKQLDNLKTFDDVHKTLSSRDGNIIFTPSSDMVHKRCFIKSSLRSCEQNSSDVNYAACKQFYSPVYFTTHLSSRLFVYMNIFCLLCRETNLPVVQKERCTLQESSRSVPGAVTSLLDYRTTAVSHSIAQYSNTKNCRCYEFLDPYQVCSIHMNSFFLSFFFIFFLSIC